MRTLFRFIQFILAVSILAIVAMIFGIAIAVGGLVFLFMSFLLGWRRPVFRVYTRRPTISPFDFERPPMRDVTPKRVESLPGQG